MEQRKHKRFVKKLKVKICSGSQNTWGILNDLSENGLLISCNMKFTENTIIDIELIMPDHENFFLKGIVRRTMAMSSSNRKFAMGVELIEKDITYRHFLKSIAGENQCRD